MSYRTREQALTAATATAARLGPAWRPYVHENLGWHARAVLTLPGAGAIGGGVEVVAHPACRGRPADYMAWPGRGGVSAEMSAAVTHANDPRRAFNRMVARMHAVAVAHLKTANAITAAAKAVAPSARAPDPVAALIAAADRFVSLYQRSEVDGVSWPDAADRWAADLRAALDALIDRTCRDMDAAAAGPGKGAARARRKPKPARRP